VYAAIVAAAIVVGLGDGLEAVEKEDPGVNGCRGSK
jgi:hypothetical protein